LLRFIGPPRNGGPHLTRSGSEGAGHGHIRINVQLTDSARPRRSPIMDIRQMSSD